MPALFTEAILREESKAVHGVDLSTKSGKELNKAMNARGASALPLRRWNP